MKFGYDLPFAFERWPVQSGHVDLTLPNRQQ